MKMIKRNYLIIGARYQSITAKSRIEQIDKKVNVRAMLETRIKEPFQLWFEFHCT